MKSFTHKIKIGIGEGAVARAPAVIIAEGLGSCVALALYDVEHGLGGMAHILLSCSSEYESTKNVVFSLYLYADSAIDALLKALQDCGSHTHNIIAKMAGGARMFPVYNGSSVGIGEQNTAYLRKLLKERHIPLVSADVGGDYGRSAEFHLNSGRVVVKALGREEREI